MEILFWVVDNKKKCLCVFIHKYKAEVLNYFQSVKRIDFFGGWGEESDIERLGYTVTKKPACI